MSADGPPAIYIRTSGPGTAAPGANRYRRALSLIIPASIRSWLAGVAGYQMVIMIGHRPRDRWGYCWLTADARKMARDS